MQYHNIMCYLYVTWHEFFHVHLTVSICKKQHFNELVLGAFCLCAGACASMCILPKILISRKREKEVSRSNVKLSWLSPRQPHRNTIKLKFNWFATEFGEMQKSCAFVSHIPIGWLRIRGREKEYNININMTAVNEIRRILCGDHNYTNCVCFGSDWFDYLDVGNGTERQRAKNRSADMKLMRFMVPIEFQHSTSYYPVDICVWPSISCCAYKVSPFRAPVFPKLNIN